MPDLFVSAAIVTKFVLYLGVINAAGTVMATLVFRLDRTRGLAAIFAVLGLIATILGFSLRGANLTGDLSGMTDPMMLSLLWATPVGTALALRIVGLNLLLLGLFLGRAGAWVSVHPRRPRVSQCPRLSRLVSLPPVCVHPGSPPLPGGVEGYTAGPQRPVSDRSDRRGPRCLRRGRDIRG